MGCPFVIVCFISLFTRVWELFSESLQLCCYRVAEDCRSLERWSWLSVVMWTRKTDSRLRAGLMTWRTPCSPSMSRHELIICRLSSPTLMMRTHPPPDHHARSRTLLHSRYVYINLCRGYVWNKIISKNYFSLRHHCPSEIILFQRVETCLKLFANYFSGLLQLVNIFRHVHLLSLQVIL